MIRTAQIFLFDTCTHKCAYCHFAEVGKVLDASQTKPYRDPTFIDQVVGFFSKRTTATDKWLLALTGGEPLLMPNFERFAEGLARDGNRIALYTAMLVGENSPAFRYLLDRGAEVTDYLMVSFHPEAEKIEHKFFDRLARLKSAGHSVIFRIVGHPARLSRLSELSTRCRDLDIGFFPTVLKSPDYPASYTREERDILRSHMASVSQLLQLEGGLDTRYTRCWAGSKLIAIDMRTGKITPCISVSGPELGNIYDDRLEIFATDITCPSSGISCSCDTFFQQNIVIGAEDSDGLAALKRGFAARADLSERMSRLSFSQSKPGIGQTNTAGFLALDTQTVKATYEKHRDYFAGAYSEHNHPEFKRRQLT